MDEGERALVAACAWGEHAAFESLLARHDAAIRAGCRRALGSRPADREEARAEVLRRLWQEAPRIFGGFRFECPLEAWLRLVAYRTALRWASGQGRTGSLPPPEAGAPAAADAASAQEELLRLQRAVGALGPEDRAFLEGLYAEGLGPREAARRAGIPPGSADWRLRRLHERLAREIGDSSSRGPAGK